LVAALLLTKQRKHLTTKWPYLAGLYYYFFNREGKIFRSLGIIFITTFLILLINGHSKPDYLAWAYPMLFASGAIDFYGGKYHLPKAISGHNSYWLWGPRGATGEVVIRLGGTIEGMKESYKDVMQVGVFKDEYCMPHENDQPIFVCKGRYRPLKDEWSDFKHYE
jgi:hypothetical protein